MNTNHPAANRRRTQITRGESRFFSNTAALAVHTLFATVFTFLQVKILAGYLSKDTFGVFASLRGLSLLFATLAAGGFPQLLMRFFPALESERRRETALWLYGASLVFSLVFLVIGFFFIIGYRSFFFAFMSPLGPSEELLFWLLATTVGWALKLVIYGGLTGIRRLPVHAVLDVAALFIQLMWIFFERFSLTVEVLFKITGIVSLTEALIGALLIIVFLVRSPVSGESTDSESGSSGVKIGGYISYWSWAVGLSVVAVAFTDVDRYLLSQVIVLEMLALFHIGSRITRLANRLLGVPNFAFQPEITRLGTEGRAQQAVVFTRIFLKFSAAISVFVAASLIAFAGEILTIVANAEYMGAAPLLVILALSMPLSAMTAPLTSVMKALDRVRNALYCDLVWAVLYVCLLFVLCFRFDIIGAGLAQLIACLAQLLLATRLSGFPLKLGFILRLGAGIFFCGGAAFAPLFIVEIILGWATPGMLTVLKALLFLLAGFVFRKMIFARRIIDREEKRVLVEMFEKRGFGLIAKLVLGRV